MAKKKENDIIIKTARYGSLYVMRYGSPRPDPVDPIHEEPIIPTPRPNPGPVRYGSPRQKTDVDFFETHEVETIARYGCPPPEISNKPSKLKRIIEILKEKEE